MKRVSVRAVARMAVLGLSLATVEAVAEPPANAQAAGSTAAPTFDAVVIVSFDGMRADAPARAVAPNLARLRREGAYALNATTVRDATTLPSHASMLSGVEPEIHGLRFDDFHADRSFIRVPTIFSTAHDAGLVTAMFVSKTKLRHIALPGSLDVWSLPHYSCERVAQAAAAHIANPVRGITFVHFSEPDDAGHMHRWMSRRYLAAIARADQCLGTVVAAIASRPDRDRVMLIVTADHGGHRRRHGTPTPVDMRIPWIAWGRGIRPGDFRDAVRTLDTAATVLEVLGLTRPAWMVGRPVSRVVDAGRLPRLRARARSADASRAPARRRAGDGR